MKPRHLLMIAAFILASATSHAPAQRALHHQAIIEAPVGDVWNAFTTSEGFASWAVAKADIDFRIGGDMRSSYNPQSTLDDDSTIVNRILAYEPQRMLAIQNVQAPKGFQDADLFQQTWTVITLEPIALDRTQLRSVGLGYGEGPAWDALYEKFKAGNAYVYAKLQRKFSADTAGAAPIDEPATILQLLHGLAGGEWIVDDVKPDGSIFRARSVWSKAPDGEAMVGQGWLGDAAGMSAHAAMQVWREPAATGAAAGARAGEVRFQNINEAGAIARGRIELHATDTLYWHWNNQARDGALTRYAARMKFDQPQTYRFTVALIDATTGLEKPLVDVRFRHVDRAPAEFLSTSGTSNADAARALER